ncbi:DUF4390 domain-containing protein [Candidatus Reidiella endopervernicosa]|uniref:DUF4390 domain-containing protein n=1 Tax=Candidatus Reidiella endopervernicosa TaxID=2738883 RepID=A0A6N0HS84_9GAMM|nr:DUF4390 domain-containing protein [Candidatus Reidiella endopervernicosa]QKQ25259.1 DUF4390 domain-containing protein [Candidatus Reidiella endopervernicosa]
MLFALFGWLTALIAVPAAAADPGFEVRSVEVELIDEVYQLDAAIEYRLSNSALDALQSGVPLVFELQIELLHKRQFLWTETVASLLQRYELRYHAFTERYILINLNSGVQESVSGLETALYRLGIVEGVPVIDSNLLDSNDKYTVRLRASLDLNALPIPLRTLAFVKPSWYLGGDWHEVRVK